MNTEEKRKQLAWRLSRSIQAQKYKERIRQLAVLARKSKGDPEELLTAQEIMKRIEENASRLRRGELI